MFQQGGPKPGIGDVMKQMAKKPKKKGIGGAIGGMLEKMKAGVRPKMEGMVPGAPKIVNDATKIRPALSSGGFHRGEKRTAQSVVDDPAGTSGEDQSPKRKFEPITPLPRMKQQKFKAFAPRAEIRKKGG